MLLIARLDDMPADDMAVFTCFPDLPTEIQDKIWGATLTINHVIFLDFWRPDDGPRVHIKRVGADPTDIALSCRAAAARYEAIYPMYKLSSSSASLRLNVDRSVFVALDTDDLESFLKHECSSSGGLKPRHVAFRYWGDGYDLQYMTSEMRVRQRHANREIQTLVAIRRNLKTSHDLEVSARGLINTIWGSGVTGAARVQMPSEWLDIAW